MYALSLGLNKNLPQLYFNNKIIAYGDTTITTLDKLQEDGKFKTMLDETYAAPDPKNPPFVGIWHPGKGKKTVLVWDPDEEVEYETGSDYDSEEEEDSEDEDVVYEYVDEDGNVIENPDECEFEEVEDEEEKAKEKKKKDKKKDKKDKEKKKKRGVKKTGKEKKGGKVTKQYEDDFLKEKRNKKKKRTKTVQVGEFVDATKKVYVDQAKFFLNAFWNYVEEDAEKVWEWTHGFIKIDPKAEKGNELDEVHCARFMEKFDESMTAIARRELFQDIDITENKHVSLLEYCITKYKSLVKTADGQEVDAAEMVNQLMEVKEVISPELDKAQKALDKVMAIIEALEAKKRDLTERSELPGIKGKMAKNELAQLLSEDPTELNKALLTAEAALRRVKKKFGAKPGASSSSSSTPTASAGEPASEGGGLALPLNSGCTLGTIWWLDREMEEAKKYKFSGEVKVRANFG
uniref:Calcium-regulated actin-bundling protein C-terminal domain-containing protein n=1 Tax=Paramoeba aestuarina TaxID=180227 RepID=A0A7S4NWM0_9EUKA